MRTLLILTAAGLTILGAHATLAQTVTSEQTVLDAAKTLTRIRTDQKNLCVHPRTKTAAQCTADFDAVVPKYIEFTSWQALAKQPGRDPKEAAKYERKAAHSRAQTMDAVHQLERDYYPPPKQVSTTGSR